MSETNKKIEETIKSNPHHLPFQVEYEGTANSEIYFFPEIERNDEDNSYVSSFRGRELKGITVKIPEGYKGIIARENKVENEQNGNLQQPNWTIMNEFSLWTEWEHDILPTEHNTSISALEWLKISKLINQQN
ncbi:hypothetical protein BB559_001138 [Furculomyces boomerangus]|uniref:Uncharacterized protein n=2 Tax=Harpellales TaxID=61421 RepID=A0A2T9Z2V3_9FUNG|nr:hypothetical protein BB559_001138 [Furculomyces boomerangus]PVZ99661.1 hypothetical protein BB558_004300 [Smittium angustum]